MDQTLAECVANVSEGRDSEKVAAIAAAVSDSPGCRLLDVQTDADHNRSVLTFVGEPGALLEAALGMAGKAFELIDLNSHRGVHPRIGALDVLPFVPLRGIDFDDCVALANRAGEEIWARFQVPVYFYGEAARAPGRKGLANVRCGGFEVLCQAVRTDPARRPDIGGPELHPAAGAVAVGVRKVMIAYNIQLATPDVLIAAAIAREIRESSGGLPGVMAMGVPLRSRGVAQVSMNLMDYEVTPPHAVFEAVAASAKRRRTAVLASEIIGLIPQKALDMSGGADLMWENLTPDSVLENRLAAAGF
jgi:glutamate formiminotransferase